MTLCLVHHADAVGPDVDPQRPLSSPGRVHAAHLAARVHARGYTPALIWHSGKLRARQTAEAFLVACNPFAEFKMIRGVSPDDPAGFLVNALGGETRDVLVAGHLPNLTAVIDVLSPRSNPFPAHGCLALRDDGANGWVEIWRETA